MFGLAHYLKGKLRTSVQWHAVEVIQPSVILDVKDGPYRPLQPEDIMD